MNKRNLIIILVVLVLLIGAGIFELTLIDTKFASMREQLETAQEKALVENLTVDEYDQIWNYWKSNRMMLEFFLNHHETIELEMRLAEAYAYLRNGDFATASVQLCVLIELTQHIPHKCTPSVEHLL